MLNGKNHHEALPHERSRSALDFVHRLLTAAEVGPWCLERLLTELAEAFGATGAGLAGPLDGTPAVQQRVGRDALKAPAGRWPWEEDPGVPARVCLARTAVVLEAPDGGRWLVTATATQRDAGWLLWLEGPAAGVWSPAEAAALALTGQMLSRCALAGTGVPTWVRQLERSSRQRRLHDASTLAGRLAHDFGNVLTGFLGFTELALAQMAPNSVPYRYLQEGYRAAQQGTQLINKLRLFSRRTPSGTPYARLAAAVEEEAARVGEAWGSTVRLEVDVPADLPPVGVEPGLLRQLLAVLLDNARESLGPRGAGKVRVSAARRELAAEDCLGLIGDPVPGPTVELSISDDGCGMSEEVRQRLVVEPFASGKPRHRGLGLAVAYGILHAHRGGLRIESAPEKGTTVHAFLPPADPSAGSAALADSACLGRGERVLLVDEDPLALQLVRSTLERAGYRVQEETSGADAFASYTAAAADPFRLVLAGVVLPHVSGLELARRVLKHDPDVGVVLLSGEAATGPLRNPITGRPFELLVKPYEAERLLRVARNALNRDTRHAPSASNVPGPRVAVASPG